MSGEGVAFAWFKEQQNILFIFITARPWWWWWRTKNSFNESLYYHFIIIRGGQRLIPLKLLGSSHLLMAPRSAASATAAPLVGIYSACVPRGCTWLAYHLIHPPIRPSTHPSLKVYNIQSDCLLFIGKISHCRLCCLDFCEALEHTSGETGQRKESVDGGECSSP